MFIENPGVSVGVSQQDPGIDKFGFFKKEIISLVTFLTPLTRNISCFLFINKRELSDFNNNYGNLLINMIEDIVVVCLLMIL